jgi:hypothetical protein
LRDKPYNFPTRELAQAQAERQLGQELQADQSYQQRLDLFENEFDKSIKSYLQSDKSLQEGELGGRVRETLRQRALDEIRSSDKSPRSVADSYAKQAFDIAQEKKSMRNIYSSWNKLDPPSQKEIDSLRKTKEKYDKYKIPTEDYIDDLVSTQNISRGAASYIANDIRNTDAGKILYKTPENTGFEGIKGLYKNQEAQIAKKLADAGITPKDSIGSIAYVAQQKGYDGQKLLGELQKVLTSDQITEQQSRDLRERMIPKTRNLDEIWLMGFSGERKRAKK